MSIKVVNGNLVVNESRLKQLQQEAATRESIIKFCNSQIGSTSLEKNWRRPVSVMQDETRVKEDFKTLRPIEKMRVISSIQTHP